MKTLFAVFLGLSLSGLAVPSLAADEAECKTRWEAVNANKDGAFEPAEGSKAFDDAINTSGGSYADADGKLTAAEFTAACKADVFKDIK